MKSKTLRCVSVPVAAETEEAITAALQQVFETPAVVFNDLEAGTSRAQVYVEFSGRNLVNRISLLKTVVARINGTSPGSSRGRIFSRKLKPQDWAESWKRHFKPIAIGDRLLIKPSWSRRKPRAGAEVVTLDPGLSFGTGQHPTTRFCLEQLAKARPRGTSRSFLDIGTGSGILAIAAAKLGYDPVEAFDFDPDAVRIAQTNAQLNKVGKIRPARRDLTRLPLHPRNRFDVICANLTHDLLRSERSRIVNRLKPEGTLILAGILASQFAEVERDYCALGLRGLAKRTEGEWTSGAFRI
ncbi:MAG TPA: hypothetical protein DCY13_22745 [Verrucomicrobiales bacterium]|nr:hypothetical protein [Verrucomicrobiales bacterium]